MRNTKLQERIESLTEGTQQLRLAQAETHEGLQRFMNSCSDMMSRLGSEMAITNETTANNTLRIQELRDLSTSAQTDAFDPAQCARLMLELTESICEIARERRTPEPKRTATDTKCTPTDTAYSAAAEPDTCLLQWASADHNAYPSQAMVAPNGVTKWNACTAEDADVHGMRRPHTLNIFSYGIKAAVAACSAIAARGLGWATYVRAPLRRERFAKRAVVSRSPRLLLLAVLLLASLHTDAAGRVDSGCAGSGGSADEARAIAHHGVQTRASDDRPGWTAAGMHTRSISTGRDVKGAVDGRVHGRYGALDSGAAGGGSGGGRRHCSARSCVAGMAQEQPRADQLARRRKDNTSNDADMDEDRQPIEREGGAGGRGGTHGGCATETREGGGVEDGGGESSCSKWKTCKT